MPTQETMDVIEKTLETVEETIDTVERIPKVNLNGTTKKQQIIILGATALAGAIAGGGIAHFLTKRHFKAKYEQLAEQEIADAKAFYSMTFDKPSPEKLAEQYTDEQPSLGNAMEELQMGAAVDALKEYKGESETMRVSKNIFVDAPKDVDTFDLVTEMETRTETEPYIISVDEFMQGEKDYQQLSLSYFGEDDVLVDEKEKPIEDTDMVVGDDNLTKFGHGSKDHNVVYIRNDRMEIDFEVTRSHGSYKREVLGFIEHSDSRRSGKGRRFRSDEE